MANQPPPQALPDLTQLPAHQQSDTHITSHLASRFHLSLPTAVISSHAIVSLNTYTTPSVVGVELENMAARMLKRLSGRGESQAVLFLGESGSGKTTLRSHLLSAILSATSTPLSQKISLFAFLFDTLTTTKSVTTPTASKAGLFLELQYDGISQTLVGGKLLDHRLERSRVAGVPTGERNFHVLYYLLAGTSAAEKEHLGLNSPGGSDGKNGAKRWRYLGHPTQLKVGINDAEGFNHFKTALRKLEFPRTDIAEICQVLASILHIGQLEFTNSHNAHIDGDQSQAMEGGEEVVVVKNKEVLSNVAAFLGVSPESLETSLGYKTKTIHRERVTIMLDVKGARAHADELARTLYSLLVAWIIESGNERLSAAEDSVANTISIIDFPGFAQASATGSTLDQLLNNTATESIYNICLQSFFERKAEQLESEEVEVPATSYFDNSDAVRGLLKPGNGLLSIIDDQCKKGRTDQQFVESVRKRFDGKSNPAISVSAPTTTLPGSNFATANKKLTFCIKHFAGEVEYPVQGLLEDNGEVISGDLMNLFSGTGSDFVSGLFSSKAVTAIHHPKEKSAIMQGQISSKPLRMPSVMRKKGDRKSRGADKTLNEPLAVPDQGAAGQFLSSLDTLTRSITGTGTNPYFVFCLKPNDRRIANQFDSKCVRTQIRTLGIAEISQRVKTANFSVFLPFGEFLGLAEADNMIVGSEREKSELVVDDRGWMPNEARVGATGVFLSERCWSEISGLPEVGPRPVATGYYDNEDGERSNPLTPVGEIGGPSRGGGLYGGGSDSRVRLIPNQPGGLGSHIYGDSKGGYYSKGNSDEARSDAGASAFHQGDMFRNFDTKAQLQEKGAHAKEQEIEEIQVSGSRKRWMFLVWCLTFWLPTFLIKYVGRIKRPDVQVAWREKLAINMLIWLSCLFALFFTIVFPMLICPKQYVFTMDELASHNGGRNNDNGDAYVAIRGYVFDLDAYAPRHHPAVVPRKSILAYAGKDASSLFPIQVSSLCKGTGKSVDKRIKLDYKNENGTENRQIDKNARYHDFRAWTSDPRPDWFYEQMVMMKGGYLKGDLGYSPQYVSQLADKKRRMIFILHNNVYDLTDYNIGGRNWEDIEGMTGVPDSNFMDESLMIMIQTRAGQDVTKYWDALSMGDTLREQMKTCLDNLFYIGKVDTRNSVKCNFARYLILAISILLASVLLFKFFAALQFSRKNSPENLDKFVICQVPAYTEDEESLRRAIDSLARMKYDDKRKLLVVVCDGMIIGQGNDRATPRIVLDILGVPESVDPEPLSFESLGEGQKRHNMGKVYSGLYEVMGHIVPFLVLVKIGKPSEVSRPGNRGKRDTQMVIMRFLNRVHYNLPMSPLELEMHHQIRNIIGVNPTFYEFLFQIDADTVVAPDAATRMVASFLQDIRIIALCGETAIANAKHSFITMIQVYEYYISHNLAKAFESLFGSVTCLPGCFTMYRIRAAETGKPLFVCKEIIEDYSEIRVDTLHMKNLLHLGEDRYLTTLLLKHHPKYKTKYLFGAHAWTIAPDSWAVFLSQRRRWINSTIHNLMELMPMQQLCGFCCFSMRFIVFMDLLSTLVQPVTCIYLVYLIVLISRGGDVIPTTAFILLAAVYGLQAIIFIAHRKWEMIAWMIIYIIAIPVFSFALPLYSFWHMDDFTWGNTRVVEGENGRKIVISDEGKFDPADIPRKKWEDYQAELWEAQTMRGADDTQSEASGYSYATKSYAQSEWGGQGQMRQSSYALDVPAIPTRGPSRMSMAPSEMLSQRGSTFMGNHPMMGEVEMRTLDLPSDDAILAEIREILRTVDLMTVTKKSIKADLERKFGVSLDAKRAYVNSATEALLSGQL